MFLGEGRPDIECYEMKRLGGLVRKAGLASEYE